MRGPAPWLALAALAACSGAPGADAGPDAPIGARPDAARDAGAPSDAGGPRGVLVFTRTAGFRHASIDPALAALRPALEARGLRVEHTEDPARFDDAELARVDAIVFLMTTGDVLDDAQQAALERRLRAGAGFAGVHSASDTEYAWPFYGALVGAWFARHPAVQSATIVVEDRTHDATRHLAETWTREDEWYDFQRNPRPDVHVLLRVDEASYEGGGMGADHPLAWIDEVEGARTFYTALGHTDASWSEPALVTHVAAGIASTIR